MYRKQFTPGLLSQSYRHQCSIPSTSSTPSTPSTISTPSTPLTYESDVLVSLDETYESSFMNSITHLAFTRIRPPYRGYKSMARHKNRNERIMDYALGWLLGENVLEQLMQSHFTV